MSIYLKTAKKQLEKGVVSLEVIRTNLGEYCKELDYEEWKASKLIEYEADTITELSFDKWLASVNITQEALYDSEGNLVQEEISELNHVYTQGDIQARVDTWLAESEEYRAYLKEQRAKAVSEILVTTTVGNTFQGDEVSQTRMSRALLGLQIAPAGSTITWTLADNSKVAVDATELGEALFLAGSAQADLW